MNNKIRTTPPKAQGREDKEMATYELLDKLAIPYERIDHEPAATIDDCQEIDKALGVAMCKNLFLCNSQKTKFYLLMMPGEKRFDTKELSKQLGTARLSFAKAEYMEKFLGITPGAVSVMGLMNDYENKVQLLVDKDIVDEDFICCHPCVNTTSMKMKKEDIIGKFLAAIKHDYLVVDL